MDVYQRRRLVALSAIAVIFIIFVLLIRSCGGDDEQTPVAPVAGASGLTGVTSLTQADYIDQADAICLEANTSLDGVDESDPATAASDQADIIAGELQQLQTLPAPDDGTDKLNKFLSSLEKQSTAYQDKATAADRGDDAAAAELDATIDEAAADAADSAKAFGFKVCGDPSKTGDSVERQLVDHDRLRLDHRLGRHRQPDDDAGRAGDDDARAGHPGADRGRRRHAGCPGTDRRRHRHRRLQLRRRQPVARLARYAAADSAQLP